MTICPRRSRSFRSPREFVVRTDNVPRDEPCSRLLLGAAGPRLRWCPSGVLRPLDDARELDARRHTHLAEDVPQVGLDGLLAEEQLVCDLRVGLAVDHEHGELELAFGQRLERRSGRPARPRALLNAMPELP